MKKGVFSLVIGFLAMLLFPAAYGTAATEPKCYPSIAYDHQNNRYLVVNAVLDDVSEETDIYGHMINADGTPYGTEFVISNAPGDQAIKQQTSSVAYDSANQRYLVVWSDGRNRPTDWDECYGQLVNADGTLYGTEFVISDAPEAQMQPAVAYDNINERFLVAWVDWRDWLLSGTLGDVYGQLVNTDGSLNGANFIVSNAPGEQWLPSIAYDSVNQRFLVGWHGDPGSDFDIYGKFVNSDGTLSGTDFAISSAVGHQWDVVVAYDDVNKRFLVVWLDLRNVATTRHDIYGQLVNADGSPFGGNFAIANAEDGQWVPSVAYDSINERYLVAWYEYFSGNDNGMYDGGGIYDIYGQVVNANGTLGGATFVISDAVENEQSTTVAFNSNCENFLVAFLTKESGTPEIGFALVGAPNCPPEDCGNGIDDDGDGLVDCDDPDCGCLSGCPETTYSSGSSFIRFNYRRVSKDRAVTRLCVDQAFCDALKAGPEEIVVELSDCAPITIPGSALGWNRSNTKARVRTSAYTLIVNCRMGWLKFLLKNADLKACVSNPVVACVSIKDGPCLCAEDVFVERMNSLGNLKKLSLSVTGACP